MNRKKIYIAAGAAVILAVVLILIFSLTGNKNPVQSGDENSTYPYTFEEKDGGIEVTVTGDFGDYRWQCSDSELRCVTVETVSSEKDKAIFSVKPVETGLDSVVLTLEKEGNATDRIYEIDVLFSVGTDSKMMIVHSEASELQTLQIEGSDAGHQYSFTGAEEGTILLTLSGYEADTEFDFFFTDPAVAAVMLEKSEPGKTCYRIVPLTNGVTELTIYGQTGQSAVKAKVSVNDGITHIDRHEIGNFEREDDENAARMKTIEEIVGEIRLPENVTGSNCGIMARNAENGETENIGGWVSFRYDQKAYKFSILCSKQNYLVTSDMQTKEDDSLTVGGEPAEAYLRNYFSYVVVWGNSDGMNFAVEGEDYEKVCEVADKLALLYSTAEK